jgi:2-methylcitrate dehydratase PrpD
LDDSIKGAVVKVQASGGELYEAAVETALGHKSRPVSRERLVEKFRDCCSHAARSMSPQSIDHIVDLIDNLPALDDIRRIVALTSLCA